VEDRHGLLKKDDGSPAAVHAADHDLGGGELHQVVRRRPRAVDDAAPAAARPAGPSPVIELAGLDKTKVPVTAYPEGLSVVRAK